MEWSKFIFVVSVIYVCYYLFNILFDVLKSKKTSNKEEIIPMTFEDDSPVKMVGDIEPGSNINTYQKETIAKSSIPEIGVINDDINLERKEDFLTKPEPFEIDKDNIVNPTGKIKVIADNIIAGGLSYKELIKQATQGAILKSAQMDFGEGV